MLISALLVGLIVVGTFSGLNSTNRSTSIDRARSQADALAEHAEEQLRSEPIAKLVALTESHPLIETVTENGSKYTITSTAEYVSDSTGTSSCTSSSAKADYLQTTSKVTSTLIGAGKSVEESGVVSPPAGSALIVQVSESGTALPSAEVVATGPSPTATSYKLETSAKGCAILALPPGEYNINVSKAGYVDPNGYANTHEDASGSVTRSVYIPAETTSKASYNIGLAGTLKVSFTAAAEGDTFVAFNTGMSSLRNFGTAGTYSTAVESPTSSTFPTKSVFPFTTKYTVYAGTCEADLPTNNGQGANPEALVERGKITETTVPLPPVNFVVRAGTGPASAGSLMEAKGSTTDTGCAVKRTFVTNGSGVPTRPGLPYGKYTFCVGGEALGVKKKWEGSFENNSPTGPTSNVWTNSENNEHIIYLGLNPAGTPSKTGTGPAGKGSLTTGELCK